MNIKGIKDLFIKLNVLLNRTQKTLGLLVVSSSVISAGLELIGVSMIVPLINVLVKPEEVLSNRFFAWVFNDTGILKSDKITSLVIGTVIVIYLLKNAFFVFNTWLKNKYAFKIQRELSIEMMKRYFDRGYVFFLKHNYSELRQGIDGDVRSLYHIISEIIQIFVHILIVIFIGIYMIYADWRLAFGAIITGLICLIIVLGLFRRSMTESGRKLRELTVKAEKTLEETLHGIKLVMFARKESFFVDKYEKEITKRNNAEIVKTVGSEIPAYIIEAVSITGIMISIGIRTLSVDDPQGYVAVLGSFAVGMFRILPAIGRISSSTNGIIACMPGLNSIYRNFVQEDVSEFERKEEKDCVSKETFDSEISIKSVCFKYDKAGENILDSLSLKIKKGSSVAFVGESGAGKSTLADILLGLLKPQSGKMEVDDVDLSYMPDIWWNRVGYIPQTIFLTDSSILENVAYGIEKKNIDIDRVWNAIKRANLSGFVKSLPDGVNTIVGDRGVRLSGGQRQRIGIARALYTEPDILIMDEATSALDNDTERAVMDAIESLMGEITLIIIAHRLTTIKGCEHIYELKSGCLIERTYDELMGR